MTSSKMVTNPTAWALIPGELIRDVLPNAPTLLSCAPGRRV